MAGVGEVDGRGVGLVVAAGDGVLGGAGLTVAISLGSVDSGSDGVELPGDVGEGVDETKGDELWPIALGDACAMPSADRGRVAPAHADRTRALTTTTRTNWLDGDGRRIEMDLV